MILKGALLETWPMMVGQVKDEASLRSCAMSLLYFSLISLRHDFAVDYFSDLPPSVLFPHLFKQVVYNILSWSARKTAMYKCNHSLGLPQ